MVEKTGLEAHLNVPDFITVPSGAKTIDVDVLASLHNHDEAGHTVHVDDGSDVHFWHLLDERHKEVLRPPAALKAKGLEGSRTETIGGGEEFAEPQTITLDAKKLKDGRRYTMRYVLWDRYTVVAPMHVHHAPKPPPAKAPAKRKAKAKAKAARGKARKAK